MWFLVIDEVSQYVLNNGTARIAARFGIRSGSTLRGKPGCWPWVSRAG